MRSLAPLFLSFVGLCGCVRHQPPEWLSAPRESEPARPPVVLPPWQTIGKSVQGRPIRYRKIGSGYRTVLWIGGIHGNEIEGIVATKELPRAFFAHPDLQSRVSLHMVEDMNPDGRALNRRTNVNGVDLNRDFPASNRKTHSRPQPESKAIQDLILKLQPDLVIVAHSWGGRYFINYDGPARKLAALFNKLSNYPIVPSSNISATPGSMGSWCGWDMRIPTLTLEWKRGTPPDVAWTETQRAILAVIRGE